MDNNSISDFQDSWEGGVDSGVSPRRLKGFPKCAEAWNTRFRGGQPFPRCPVYLQSLTFLSGASSSYFYGEIYQGGCYYNLPTGDYMVMMIGGRVFVLSPTNRGWNVSDLTPDAGNDRYASIAYLCQADTYLIIQDGEHVPLVVSGTNGLTCFRVGGTTPIPIGLQMAYVDNRLWIANGNLLFAGDLLGSEADAVLNADENLYLNEGGSFKAPSAFGDIVSLSAIAVQDSATGQGSLMAKCEGGIFTVNGLIPRDQWKESSILQITLPNIGATGHRSECNVNGDQWFRSHDGWRTYRQARAEINGWNQIPLSSPVGQYVKNDTDAFLPYGSAIYWDNRLFVTSGPTVSNNRPSHRGLLSLDFDPITNGFGDNPQPAWDGFWTLPGNVTELLTGTFNGSKRALAMCIVNGQNVLYEIKSDGYQDNGTTDISWSPTSKAMFVNMPNAYTEKILDKGGSFRVSKVIGNVSMTLKFRQDDAKNWKTLKTFTFQGQQSNCLPSTEGSCSIAYPTEFYVPFEVLPLPDDTTDAVSDRADTRFYEIQFKWEITGYLELQNFRPQAIFYSDKQEKPD